MPFGLFASTGQEVGPLLTTDALSQVSVLN